MIALVREFPFEVDLTRMQDRVYEYLETKYVEHASREESQWVRQFAELCNRLKLQLPRVSREEEASLRAS